MQRLNPVADEVRLRRPPCEDAELLAQKEETNIAEMPELLVYEKPLVPRLRRVSGCKRSVRLRTAPQTHVEDHLEKVA